MELNIFEFNPYLCRSETTFCFYSHSSLQSSVTDNLVIYKVQPESHVQFVVI